MKVLTALLGLVLSAMAQTNRRTPKEAADDWRRPNTQGTDYSWRVDFQTAADDNGDIFLRSAKGRAPHVSSYELPIFDAPPKFPTGSIPGAGREESAGPERQ